MITPLTALGLLSLLFLIEARLEKTVIALKNYTHPQFKKLDKDEHRWSFIFASVVILPVCVLLYTTGATLLILPALVARRIFFDFPLAIFNNRPLTMYEGDDATAKLLRRIFGKHGRLRELLAMSLIYFGGIFIYVYLSGLH